MSLSTLAQAQRQETEWVFAVPPCEGDPKLQATYRTAIPIQLRPGDIVDAKFGTMSCIDQEQGVLFKVDDKYLPTVVAGLEEAKKLYYDPSANLSRTIKDIEPKKGLIVVGKEVNTIVRGQIHALNEDETFALLYLIDEASYAKFPTKDLYLTTNKLAYLPMMNVLVNLLGLNFFMRPDCCKFLRLAMEEAESKGFLRMPFELSCVKTNQITKWQLEAPVVLAWIKNPNGTKENLNQWLITKCVEKTMTRMPNTLYVKFKGQISHIEMNGTIYIQLNGSLADELFEYLKEYKMSDFSALAELTLEDIKMEEIYLAVHSDGLMYRCKVVSKEPVKDNPDKVQIQYIDWGNKDWCFPMDLVKAKDVCLSLAKIPPAASKGFVANVAQFKTESSVLMDKVYEDDKSYTFEVIKPNGGIKILDCGWMSEHVGIWHGEGEF